MPTIHRAWLIMAAGAAIAAAGLGTLLNTAGVFIRPVSEALGVGRGTLSIYLSILFLAMALMGPLVGRLYTRVDARWLISGGVLLAAGAVAAMSQFTQVWQWYIAGAVMGVGAAFIFFVAVPFLVNNWFVARRGLALGIAIAFSGIGGAIMNPIADAAIQARGWRWAYVMVAVVALVLALPLTLAFVRSRPSDVGLEPYGYVPGADVARPAAVGVPFATARRSGSFWLAWTGVFLFSICAAFLTHMPGFATSVGQTPAFGALLGSALLIGNVAGKFSLGAVGDKLGAKLTVTIGLALVGLGFAVLAFGFSVAALLLVGAFLVGISQSLASVAAPLLITELFGTRDFARLFGYTTSAVSLASAVGQPGIGFVYDAAGTYLPAIYAAIGCVVVAWLLILASYQGPERLWAVSDPSRP